MIGFWLQLCKKLYLNYSVFVFKLWILFTICGIKYILFYLQTQFFISFKISFASYNTLTLSSPYGIGKWRLWRLKHANFQFKTRPYIEYISAIQVVIILPLSSLFNYNVKCKPHGRPISVASSIMVLKQITEFDFFCIFIISKRQMF